MRSRPKTPARAPYKDPVTTRRHRVMLGARAMLLLPAIGVAWWNWPVWPLALSFVAWYAVWFFWAAGGLEHR